VCFVIRAVDLHRGRRTARRQALDRFERETAVGRRLADTDAEPLLQVRDDAFRSAQ
jgi:hypothetical protein